VALNDKNPIKAVMLKNLHSETERLDVAAEIDAAIKRGPDLAAGATAVAAGDANPNATPPAPDAATTTAPPAAAPEAPAVPATPEVPATPAVAAKPEAPKAPEKSLADLARSTRSSADSTPEVIESGNFDRTVLAKYSDSRMKEVTEALKRGSAAYKKATADFTDRGPARNTLLKSAHDDFVKSIDLMEESIATQPDPKLEQLVQRVSMMVYATLKFQTL
jgi:hypothetical protein